MGVGFLLAAKTGQFMGIAPRMERGSAAFLVPIEMSRLTKPKFAIPLFPRQLPMYAIAMAIRVAILGLDGFLKRDWLQALATLRAAEEIELAGIGHRSLAAARDTADAWKHVTGDTGREGGVFDDPRLMLKELGAEVVVIDRPQNVPTEFLLACMQAGVGLFSLGPLVESVTEAHALSDALGGPGVRSKLLYTFPRFVDGASLRHCAQAEEFIRPIRFASATWVGASVALMRGKEMPAGGMREMPVRSLSVLMWDALATVIGLLEMPTSVFAAIKGTVGSGNSFADVSGAAAITLRFADDAAASITVCDWMPEAARGGRELMLWGAGGTLKVDETGYEYRSAEGGVD